VALQIRTVVTSAALRIAAQVVDGIEATAPGAACHTDNPTIERRAVFTRQLAALLHDAYLLDGWEEHEVWP